MQSANFRICAKTSKLRMMTITAMFALLGLGMSHVTQGEPIAGGVPAERIAHWAKHLPPQPSGVGVPISRRDVWDVFARDKDFRSVIGQAEDELKRPIAETPDELYLDFSQTGNRRRYRRVFRHDGTAWGSWLWLSV